MPILAFLPIDGGLFGSILSGIRLFCRHFCVSFTPKKAKTLTGLTFFRRFRLGNAMSYLLQVIVLQGFTPKPSVGVEPTTSALRIPYLYQNEKSFSMRKNKAYTVLYQHKALLILLTILYIFYKNAIRNRPKKAHKKHTSFDATYRAKRGKKRLARLFNPIARIGILYSKVIKTIFIRFASSSSSPCLKYRHQMQKFQFAKVSFWFANWFAN